MGVPDRTIAELARRQHGLVTRRQLLRAGLSAKQIEIRLARGSLIRAHRGVFRVGHVAPSVEATYLAAVFACGRGAELMGNPAVPRTLMDLVLPEQELVRACHEAQVRFGVRPEQTHGHIRKILEGHVPVTLSALEARFLELLREHGLPIPRTNRRAGTKRVDCRWPAHSLTVELDSYRFHNTRHAFENDRRREREAHARGDQHRRYTYGDVFDDPRPMLAELRGLLA